MIIPDKTAENNIIDAYAASGLTVVRVSPEKKKPIDTGWQKEHWPLDTIKHSLRNGWNVGVQVGEVSGWIAAVDCDCKEAVALAPRLLPPTLTSGKQGIASHYVYRSPGLKYAQFNSLSKNRNIDLLASDNGQGRQFVVAPSIHPEKGSYEWYPEFDPERVSEVDKDVLRQRVGLLAVAVLVAQNLPTSGRHDLAMALAGFMLRNGVEDEDALEVLTAAWEYHRAPSDAFKDLESIVSDTRSRLDAGEPVKGGPSLEEDFPGLPKAIHKALGWKNADGREGQRRSYMMTDVGNGERFAAQHHGAVMYCYPWSCWMVYDGRRWALDNGGAVIALAKRTARCIFDEAREAKDNETSKKLAMWAIRSQGAAALHNMIEMAKSEDGMAVPVDTRDFLPVPLFDRDPWLLNVNNGTLNLKTGELAEHDPADLITKLAPVDYDPDAEAPVFERFLKEVLPSESLRTFVQRLAGYALTGFIGDHVLPFFHGAGSNGKSTLVNVLIDVLGDYAMQAPPDLLVIKQRSHPTELADLFGKRFVASVEVEDGSRLAESLVKQLTGGDNIRARRMRENFWQFSPTHKAVLVANHKPEVRGTDHAIWRRIKMVPFDVIIREEDKDERLPEKLKAEMPGILAWGVRGCMEWQRVGLATPEEVIEATNTYRAEEDVLASFIADRCVIHPSASVGVNKLFSEYETWAEGNLPKREILKKRDFARKLESRGFYRERASRGEEKGRVLWFGIGIESEDPDPDGVFEDGGEENFTNPESGGFAISKPNVGDVSSRSEETELKSDMNGHAQPRVEVNAENASLSSLASPDAPNGSKTRVVNLKGKLKKGEELPEHVLYIGRRNRGLPQLPYSKWANPFKVEKDEDGNEKTGGRREALDDYEEHVRNSPELMNALHEIDGKVLGCWCAPKPCHGDVLLKLRAEQKDAEALAGFLADPPRWFLDQAKAATEDPARRLKPLAHAAGYWLFDYRSGSTPLSDEVHDAVSAWFSEQKGGDAGKE